MRRATLDSNIYVSAFRFGGKPLDVVDMALDGQIEIAISQHIIDETLRILADKFKFSALKLQSALDTMHECAVLVETGQRLDVVPSDADDNRIIECALASGSEAIVTGDKDLLRLGQYGGVKMLTVRDWLDRAKGRK